MVCLSDTHGPGLLSTLRLLPYANAYARHLPAHPCGHCAHAPKGMDPWVVTFREEWGGTRMS